MEMIRIEGIAWIIKYLIVISMLFLFLKNVKIGINLNRLISIPIQFISHEEDEIVNSVLINVIKIKGVYIIYLYI